MLASARQPLRSHAKSRISHITYLSCQLEKVHCTWDTILECKKEPTSETDQAPHRCNGALYSGTVLDLMNFRSLDQETRLPSCHLVPVRAVAVVGAAAVAAAATTAPYTVSFLQFGSLCRFAFQCQGDGYRLNADRRQQQQQQQ